MAQNVSFRIDFGNVMKHVEHMRKHFPDRKSGAGLDVEAGRYIVEQMRSYGLDAALESFEAFDSDIGSSRLALDGHDGAEIASLPCLHVEPTPASGITAELVDVGPGGLSDYEGRDVAGKLVLAEVSYAPATPEKARIAATKGAAGLVLMNWGKDESNEIAWRSLKSVWGNPTPENFAQIPRIAGVSISRADGISLRRRLATSSVRLHMHLTARRAWRTLRQPVAWLNAPEGAPERDHFVVVSSHVDGWNPGVTDNISGMAAMLELARSLACRRDMLRRSVVFCSWNGHEVAEAAGSTYFVDAYWERLNRDAVAYLNIDSVGMKGASEFHVSCCPELTDLAEQVSEQVFGDKLPRRVSPLRRIGDQSFFGIGVPAITGRHAFDADVIAAYNGASLGWYNHTGFDTLDQLDPATLEADVRWNERVLEALVLRPALPYRFARRVSDLRARYGKALEDSRQRSNLERIIESLDALDPEIRWLDALLADGAAKGDMLVRADGVALRVARQLTFIGETAVGKYGQDSYGASQLLEPVPLLECLRAYAAAPPGSEAERLLWTKLIRLRHQVTDAIELARAAIADFRMYAAGEVPQLTTVED